MGSTVDTHTPPVLEVCTGECGGVRIKGSLDGFLKEECPAPGTVLNAYAACRSVRLEAVDI